MSTSPKVCLQINFAAGDVRYVSETLPHQLRAFAEQVDEVQFTLDTVQNRVFRGATDDFERNLGEMRRRLATFCADVPHAELTEVDYSPAAMREVSATFLGDRDVPNKACDGSAFYAYLFGMHSARADYVFHIDSDMLFGGASPTWIAEAVALLETQRDVFACFPFAGPPKPDRTASARRLTSIWGDVAFEQTCESSDLAVAAYRYNEVSTRALLFDKRRFASGELRIPLVRPRLRRAVRAAVFDVSTYLLLEDCLTVMMNERKLNGIGFLGADPGLWSLHIRYRSEGLYARLPDFILHVEMDQIPDAQRGDFDMNAAMIDWTDAHRKIMRRRRYPRELRLVAQSLVSRLSGGPHR